jgi:SAM-dependent methyltransferase
MAAMSTTHVDRYSLGRTPEEYERLRVQAAVWETATGRLFGDLGLAPGASCLDAGCGPGDTMRLMAERVGAGGRVVGLDMDGALGEVALARLHEKGHRQCAFHAHDLSAAEPIPGAPYDLVFARLLLFHIPERVAALARLWDAVAPGGHLLVQDYDLQGIRVLPPLGSVDAATDVVIAAFTSAGADVHIGARLPELFALAGLGDPDGTDVAGRLDSFANGHAVLDRVFRSVLPTALAHGITSEMEAAATLAAFERDAAQYPDRPFLWPLMVGAWKRKGR